MRRIETKTARPPAVTIELDGRGVDAYPGESLATVILASGTRRFRSTRSGAPRGPFCNMGVCFECSVTVNGQPSVRACMTRVEPGMKVMTG